MTILFSFMSLIFFIKSSNKINANEVPYIATYYINPIVSPSDDVIITFYITDYNHSNYNNYIYKNDDYTEISSNAKFSVRIKLDNSKKIIKHNLKAGDNSINIGKVTTLGEHTFSILCFDKYGRNSHEVFNSFLVKDSTDFNEYVMVSSDLIKYNIDNTNNIENGLSTLNGLQKLLDDKKLEGYNKLKLLPGVYRIDHSTPIYIPSEFTLNLNEATIKLNGFTGNSALMIDLNNTFDSHVVNGTIEGDYYEHDYENSPNNSEWVMGISITGESKYSSYENLVIKNITGYGAGNSIGYSRNKELYYTYFQPISIGSTFKLSDINRKNGKEISSTCRTTCDFIDISQYTTIGYLSISRYLGYQGNSCGTWNLICHFYDENKNYINSVDSYQYRILGVPKNSKYMRVTILNEDYPTDLSVQLFRVPTNCSFKNLKFENCRAVGLAQSAMKNMLVENCEFVNCGQTLAKSAYVAEDGADMMQDVTFRKLNFHDNPNNDFLSCAGHNFIIEEMIAGKLYFWGRTNSFVVRNNNNISSVTIHNDSKLRAGYIRFYNNTINISINIKSQENNICPLNIKNCTINGRAESSLNDRFIECNIGQCFNTNSSYFNSLGSGTFINCTISDKNGFHNYSGNYYNCTIKDISGSLIGNFNMYNCKLNNYNCYLTGESSSCIFNNCSLINSSIIYNYWFTGADLTFKNCIINNTDYILKLPHYSMKFPITFINNTFNSTGTNGMILFYDDRILNTTDQFSSKASLTLKGNIVNTPNSDYIISGLNKNTKNNINIIIEDNTLQSDTNLYNFEYNFSH